MKVSAVLVALLLTPNLAAAHPGHRHDGPWWADHALEAGVGFVVLLVGIALVTWWRKRPETL